MSILADEGYPLLMHSEHLCRLLGIHPNTLLKRIQSGQVPAFTRVGTGQRARYEWYRPQVERWLEHRKPLRRVV